MRRWMLRAYVSLMADARVSCRCRHSALSLFFYPGGGPNDQSEVSPIIFPADGFPFSARCPHFFFLGSFSLSFPGGACGRSLFFLSPLAFRGRSAFSWRAVQTGGWCRRPWSARPRRGRKKKGPEEKGPSIARFCHRRPQGQQRHQHRRLPISLSQSHVCRRARL